MFYAGIDAGSRTIKAVIIDGESLEIAGHGIIYQGVKQSELAKTLFNRVLAESRLRLKDIDYIVATGYGRNNLDWVDTTVTEITCHAYGVKYNDKDVRTIIDIGGQDSKLIRLDEHGCVRDFVMNDRCAAGTGYFLEIISQRLEVSLNKLGAIAAKAENPSPISSMCVVFAETEIVGLLASGESIENITAGVQISIAKRIFSMGGAKIHDKVILTGGVALIEGMDNALKKELNHNIVIAKNPQMTGALGAAIIACNDKNRRRDISFGKNINYAK